jgi:hypothetical protein
LLGKLFPLMDEEETHMKTRLLIGAALLAVAGGAFAQDQATRFTDRDGNQVTLHSGQPQPTHYGPAPDFGQLDKNRDGALTRDEAEAFLPLFNDFDHLAHHVDRISQRQYDHWAKNEYRE